MPGGFARGACRLTVRARYRQHDRTKAEASVFLTLPCVLNAFVLEACTCNWSRKIPGWWSGTQTLRRSTDTHADRPR